MKVRDAREAKRSTRASALLVACALSSLAAGARAQLNANAAAAQGLFDEGKALMAAGKANEACPKFEESQRLDPASGTLLNLARCYEETHRLATAWSTYLEAATAARASGNAEREDAARKRAAALAPRIPKVIVQVPVAARITGLEVMRDGSSVGIAQWGTPIPTDEGEHTLVAKADGHKEWSITITVKGEGTTAQVAVPVLEIGVTQAGEAEQGAPQRDATEPKSTGLGTQRVAALVSGGIGVAGVVVGTIFGLKSKSDHDEAAKYCDGASCRDQRGVSAGNAAHAAGNVATVSMIVGGVALAAGAVLWFTAPETPPHTELGLGPGGVQVRGKW